MESPCKFDKYVRDLSSNYAFLFLKISDVFRMMDRVIFHVDMDAFYASCEVSRNPELKKKPLIIGADPQEGKGRGVVMTSSYEARKIGVRSGMPISRAYKLCPQGIYLRPDMKFYKEISDKVMEILRFYADADEEIPNNDEEISEKGMLKFEQWGFDEAFLDVSQKILDYPNPKSLAQQIQQEILTKLNLTCSIGIGPNKQVAKIASDYKKPSGVTFVPPIEVQKFLDPLSVDKIIGIGPKTKRILEKLEIKTISDLANYPASKLNDKFGKLGIYLHNIARGIDNSPVRQRYKRKSIGSEITFSKDVDNFNTIYETLKLLVDKLHKSLIKRRYFYQVVVIKIRFSNFSTYTRQQKLKTPTNEKAIALQTGKKLLKEFESKSRKVRLLGFRFTQLSKAKYTQKTLVD